MIFTIALDGPAAAGKGTIAKALAAEFGLMHLDTGLIYRAVGKKTLDAGRPLSEADITEIARGLSEEDVQEQGLRTSAIAQAASRVAAISSVRDALIEVQRTFARREGGAVLDGRDIGTVICPEADVKFFVTASPEVRAQRRFEELRDRGEDVQFDDVLEAVRLRDERDSGRESAPLRQAEDAVVIDTSDLSVESAVAIAVEHARRALART